MSGIDFAKIRIVGRGQDEGFEEMVCQLGRLEPPAKDARWFRGRGAGGDGGVEAHWTLADGSKVAYQAKYHPDGEIDWGKVNQSVQTALKVHPTIRRYIIAFPCNLTPKTARTHQKSGVEHWEELEAKFPGITFARWDETELLARLIRPEPAYVGIKAWFFDLPHWTAEWFRERFEVARADLGERYHADEHVTVEAAEAFEGLALTWMVQSKLDELLEVLGKCTVCLQHSKFITKNIGIVNQLIATIYNIICEYSRSHHGDQLITSTETACNGILLLAEGDGELLDCERRLYMPWQIASRFGCYGAEEIDARRLFDLYIELRNGLSDPVLLADRKRAILLTGPAGTGKSHLLADVADRATREVMPALLVPGQWLNAAADPWGQIKARWDAEKFSTEQVLGALNAAAEAANRRAVILIDALNESGDAGKWRDNLGSLVKTILSYPYLAVAVSCRSDYLDWVVPEALRESFVTVECKGFASPEEQEQAAQVFLDRKGIARPAMPWLAPDFTNPLFLRVTAEGLKAEGKTAYPQLVGLPDFFCFFLASLAARPPFDRWPDRSLLRVCLEGLAEAMVAEGQKWLSLAQATGAIRSALGRYDGDDTPSRARALLDDLKRGALLPRLDPQGTRDGVNFVFERLGDLLMAEAVVDRINAASFQDGGDLTFVGRDPKAWSGLLGALAILVPQRRGEELLDVAQLRQDAATAHRQFRDSLLWRTAEAFLPATERWFEQLPDEYKLEVRIRLAPVPGHKWNADQLDGWLRPLPMPDRDVAWSVPLAMADDDAKLAIGQIIAWALGPDCGRADDETLRLTATLLAWMLTTSARPIRDRATKALAHVFLLRPTVMAGILVRFHGVDDPYLVERLWAAAYGAAMNAGADWPLADLACQSWTLCFADGRPPASLRTRDHAQGIVELAEARGVLPSGITLERCRPPFVTDWPLEEVDEAFVETQQNEEGAWGVASSTTAWDFGCYTVQPAVERWSDVPLTEPPPLTGEQRYDQFVADVVEQGSTEIRAAWEAYKAAEARQHEQNISTPPLDGAGVSQEEALSAFLARLPQEEALFAERCLRDRSIAISGYAVDRAQRWIGKRVVDLGWTVARFADFERPLRDHGGERPEVERIGKKYQWIALDELLARLSDNVHHIAQWLERIAPYRNSADQPYFRDCDPSILATPEKNDPWWLPREIVMEAATAEAAHAWVLTDENAEIVPDLFVVEDTDRRQWLRLYGHIVRFDGQAREYCSRVTTVLVRTADRIKVLASLEGKHIFHSGEHQVPHSQSACYLGELLWRGTWAAEVEEVRGGLSLEFPVIWPVIEYHWESTHDLSLGGARFHLPSRWLCQAMGLSDRALTPGVIVDGDGEAVFVGHAEGAVIDSQRFLSFLEGSEWDCLWLIGGQKEWRPDGMGHWPVERWTCHYHSGVFWWDKGWQSRIWSVFQSRGI